MIKDFKVINKNEVLVNWAISEANSEGWRKKCICDEGLPLSPELRKKISQDTVSYIDFSEEERQKLIGKINRCREMLLRILPTKIDWYKGNLFMEDLENLEMINWGSGRNAKSGAYEQSFVDFTGTKKLSDFINKLRAGMVPQGQKDFVDNLDKLRRNFQLEKMKGAPIILSKSKTNPPYRLMDGFTRISAILWNFKDGMPYEKIIPVFLGVSDQLD